MVADNTSVILMHKDTPVLKFNFETNEYKVLNEKFMPYRLRDRILEVNQDTDSIQKQISIIDNNRNNIINYFSLRVMSFSRSNAKKLYHAYNLNDQSQDPLTRAKVCIVCQGLSAIDSYWIKPENSDKVWSDVNVRTNHLSDILASVALGFEKPRPSLEGRPASPEIMGQGAYAKAWKRYDDGLYLLKKSTPGEKQSEIEVEVSNILDCFSVNHVKYTASQFEGHFVSKCKNLATEKRSIVDANEIYAYCNNHNIEFEQAAKQIDPDMFYSTCVVDYLISNPDRHSGNWGFFMDDDTGKITGMHPMFDHNNAFDSADMQEPDGGKSQMMEGKSKQEAAKYAIKHCDFRCIKPVTRSMFINYKHYKSFMSRASELGLYKEHKKSFVEKLGLKYCEEYEPVEIDTTPRDYLRKKGDIDTILNLKPKEKSVFEQKCEEGARTAEENNKKRAQEQISRHIAGRQEER